MVTNSATGTSGPYPTGYEAEAVLKDGSSLLLRPIKADDAEKLLGFVQRLKPATREQFSVICRGIWIWNLPSAFALSTMKTPSSW